MLLGRKKGRNTFMFPLLKCFQVEIQLAVNVNENPATPLNTLCGCYFWHHGTHSTGGKVLEATRIPRERKILWKQLKNSFCHLPCYWAVLRRFFFPVPHHVFLPSDKIPPEHSLSRLKPPSFLGFPLYIRCSKALITLVALCWTHSSRPLFLQ